MSKTNGIVKDYEHVSICKHPLKANYMVFCKSFPSIPPYFGTLKECERAAEHANKMCAQRLKEFAN